jgi:hypothetical protein
LLYLIRIMPRISVPHTTSFSYTLILIHPHPHPTSSSLPILIFLDASMIDRKCVPVDTNTMA